MTLLQKKNLLPPHERASGCTVNPEEVVVIGGQLIGTFRVQFRALEVSQWWLNPETALVVSGDHIAHCYNHFKYNMVDKDWKFEWIDWLDNITNYWTPIKPISSLEINNKWKVEMNECDSLIGYNKYWLW